MREMPKKFPEYSIMYKTLSRQIKILEEKVKKVQGEELEGIQLKIQRYESEMSKIKKMFPDNFFEELN